MTPQARSNSLPYRMLAGVVPCRNGWLVQAGRLQGVSLYPVPPAVLPTLQDVLDWKPSFEFIAIHIPLGLPEKRGPRECDIEARRLLKWPRSLAITAPPIRPVVNAESREQAISLNGGSLPATWHLMPWIREAATEIQSYNQRVVHEVHPETSFYELNGGVPMRYSKRKAGGRDERRSLLATKMQNVTSVLDIPVKGPTRAKQLDACICLWTARRIAARGAAVRLPDLPEWDDEGMRMEIWR